MCCLQTQNHILYAHGRVMTLHILRQMAITVHQCSTEFIQKTIETTGDMYAYVNVALKYNKLRPCGMLSNAEVKDSY